MSTFNEMLIEECELCSSDLKVIESLIEKGANNFNEALKKACTYGHVKIAALLIEKGANNFGEALDAACMHTHDETIELLINHITAHRITL